MLYRFIYALIAGLWLLFSTLASAVPAPVLAPEPATASTASVAAASSTPAPAKTSTPNKVVPSGKTAGSGIVINQQLHQQIQQNTARLAQLEQANQDALARNQELQLMNDNLTVQVQVLQSERSTQMFLYGAATLAVGAFIGFLLANYILSKRTRRW